MSQSPERQSHWVWPIALSVLLALGMVLGIALGCATTFDSADDTGMMAVASGMFSGVPGAYLSYMNVLIGQLLQFGYTVLPHINWYTVLIFSAHALGLFLLCYVTLRRGITLGRVLALLLLLGAFELQLLLNPQFTSTAIVLGMGGMLAAYFIYQQEGKLHPVLAVLLALSVTGTALLRLESGFLLFFTALPLLVTMLMRKPEKGVLIFVTLSLLLTGGGKLYNDIIVAQHPAWAHDTTYSITRARLLDYPALIDETQTRQTGIITVKHDARTQQLLRAVGWSPNDALLFNHLIFNENATYSLAHLQTLARQMPSTRSVAEGIRHLYDAYHAILFPCWLALLILLSALILLPRKERTVLLVMTLITLLIFVYLGLYKKIPPRVTLPLLFFLSSTAVLCCAQQSYHTFFAGIRQWTMLRLLSVSVPATLLLLCFIFQCRECVAIGRINAQRQIQFRRMTNILAQTPDALYVTAGMTFPFEWLPTTTDITTWRRLNFVGTGWSAHSPRTQPMLQQYLITDLLTTLANRPDVHLICSRETADIFVVYSKEHEGRDLTPVLDHRFFTGLFDFPEVTVFHFAPVKEIR